MPGASFGVPGDALGVPGRPLGDPSGLFGRLEVASRRRYRSKCPFWAPCGDFWGMPGCPGGCSWGVPWLILCRLDRFPIKRGAKTLPQIQHGICVIVGSPFGAVLIPLDLGKQAKTMECLHKSHFDFFFEIVCCSRIVLDQKRRHFWWCNDEKSTKNRARVTAGTK